MNRGRSPGKGRAGYGRGGEGRGGKRGEGGAGGGGGGGRGGGEGWKKFILIVKFLLLMFVMLLTNGSSSSPSSLSSSERKGLPLSECRGTPCSCTEALTTGEILADCSGKNLAQIPAVLPANIMTLNFSNNVLSSVEDTDIKIYTQLRILDLSFNNIASLARHSFHAVTRLENLHLNANYLSARQDSLPFTVFDNLTSLIELKLHDNPRDQTPLASPNGYRDDLFVKLVSLQWLSIDGVPMAQFGKGFSKLINLYRLEIYNNLTVVTNTTFRHFSRVPIQHLSIKTGKILRALEPESFAHFYNLSVLDLSYNRGLDLTQVSAAWYGLQNTTIRELILTRIIHIGRQTTDIEESFYRYLDKTKIKKISLDRNNIVQTYPGLSKYLKHVTHLDMSYNRLSNIGSLIADFERMRELKILDASHQNKRYVGVAKRSVSRTTRSLRSTNSRLKDINLSQCKPTETAPTGKALCPVLEFNKNGTFPLSDKGPWCFIAPPHLEVFDLSASLNIDLQFMPQITALGGRRMREFIYRANGISFFTGPLILGYPRFSDLIRIDGSDNGIKCIAPDIFRYMIQRKARFDRLTFSNNNLYVQLEQDVTGDVFKYYTYLTQLDLDRNGIKSLPAGIFRNLSALEVLNLSGNSMRLLEFEFSHMKHLRLLDISNNLITLLDENTLTKIDDSIHASNMSLNLYGNPIQCSCDTLPLLTWMQERHQQLVDFNTYYCMYKGNKHMSFRELENQILVELHLLCSTGTALWVSAFLLGLAIVAVFLSVVVYRHRWDIRYYLLRLRNDRKQLIDSEERQKQYEYDGFIIYDHRDIQWVKNELDAKLGKFPKIDLNEEPVLPSANQRSIEGDQERFRFCIHDRDFAPGAHIDENISSAIISSRKMVLIISSNILSSPWCKFELHLAISENVQRGFNTIVPIMLDSLSDISAMSESLQLIVRSLTYIQWPQEELERPEFWRQLKDALRER